MCFFSGDRRTKVLFPWPQALQSLRFGVKGTGLADAWLGRHDQNVIERTNNTIVGSSAVDALL